MLPKKQRERGRDDALIVYIALIASFFTAVAIFVALIYAYVRRNEIRETIYYSHLNYVIRTIWLSFLFTVVGAITLPIFIGYFILIATLLWLIYRTIIGFIAFKEGEGIY